MSKTDDEYMKTVHGLIEDDAETIERKRKAETFDFMEEPWKPDFLTFTEEDWADNGRLAKEKVAKTLEEKTQERDETARKLKSLENEVKFLEEQTTMLKDMFN
ncbi:hypothetical protein BDF20DRAFT_646617 [Mycotypha africana]|uniref:uncharacterized protein n=1 Tax=Mycotypha africana TaxID=64632 RepID=UPI002300EFA3|nr:uncharacterized protein BDF20DRAFT_646617 [Mycotypha africana]KAI8973353.1 hypothetical protein BDF20DRAFT_646617 [Mycotypha africana]